MTVEPPHYEKKEKRPGFSKARITGNRVGGMPDIQIPNTARVCATRSTPPTTSIMFR